MNGAGKKLWGWYPTDKVWVPIQVDATGKPVVNMSSVKLDDLGDVAVPTPGDQYFVYWDATTSLWKCRALVDGDIPAAIARDAEVTAAVAAEATARNVAIAAVKLDDLTDVSVPTPTDGYVLYWDDATSLWKCKAVAGGGGGTKIQDADADTSWDVEQAADEDHIHGKVAGVEGFLMHEDGIIDLAKQSGCSARIRSNQAITDSTPTLVNIGTAYFDIQGEWNATAYRFTVKKAGYYLVLGRIYWFSGTADTLRETYFKRNNAVSSQTMADCYPATSNLFSLLTTPSILSLAAGDYLELWCYQNSGANVYILNGYCDAYFWKLG